MANILTVDDSATIRQLLKSTLVGAGHQVFQASDGVEGLVVARDVMARLVITDINMPKMDGLTMVKELRRVPAYRHVPILVLTTENGGAMKGIAKAAGATGWITKPFDPAKLLSAIRRVLG